MKILGIRFVTAGEGTRPLQPTVDCSLMYFIFHDIELDYAFSVPNEQTMRLLTFRRNCE